MKSTDNPKGEALAKDDNAPALWKSGRMELLGFANVLDRSNSGITASQIRMAVALADQASLG